MTIHMVFANWVRLAILNFTTILLILMLFFWKRQPFKLVSWMVVAISIVLLCLTPSILHSSFSLLILFICYTLLPLQLRETLAAAAAITAVALAVQLFKGPTTREIIAEAL